MMYLAPLLVFLSCKGCITCMPPLPSSDTDATDDSADSADTDSADTVDTADSDTGPPPPCDQPEVEPNDAVAEAQPIQMESWSCGTIQTDDDVEYLGFSNTESGWMRVWVRGFDIGSHADLYLQLHDGDGQPYARAWMSPNSTDPFLVFPVSADQSWYARISDQYAGSSEDHIWKAIASLSKQPEVEWDALAGETGDTVFEAFDLNAYDLAGGVRLYGTVESNRDRDWFIFDVAEGKTVMNATLDAWARGSPLDGVLVLYRLDLSDPDAPAATELASATRGVNTSDLDPDLEVSIGTAGTYALMVRENSGLASDAYWYVLDMTVQTEAIAPDTGP